MSETNQTFQSIIDSGLKVFESWKTHDLNKKMLEQGRYQEMVNQANWWNGGGPVDPSAAQRNANVGFNSFFVNPFSGENVKKAVGISVWVFVGIMVVALGLGMVKRLT